MYLITAWTSFLWANPTFKLIMWTKTLMWWLQFQANVPVLWLTLTIMMTPLTVIDDDDTKVACTFHICRLFYFGSAKWIDYTIPPSTQSQSILSYYPKTNQRIYIFASIHALHFIIFHSSVELFRGIKRLISAGKAMRWISFKHLHTFRRFFVREKCGHFQVIFIL